MRWVKAVIRDWNSAWAAITPVCINSQKVFLGRKLLQRKRVGHKAWGQMVLAGSLCGSKGAENALFKLNVLKRRKWRFFLWKLRWPVHLWRGVSGPWERLILIQSGVHAICLRRSSGWTLRFSPCPWFCMVCPSKSKYRSSSSPNYYSDHDPRTFSICVTNLGSE